MHSHQTRALTVSQWSNNFLLTSFSSSSFMGQCTRQKPDPQLTTCSFKGTNTTFENFPSRLEHVLKESIDSVKVECVLFPAYEVRPFSSSHSAVW